jgi:non-ribosomal peptide synthetase component F
MTDAGGGIHRLFEERVAHTPNACAVAVEGGQLTYLELDTRANQLARYLQRRGVRRGTFVALCLDRSLDVAIAILGVLKAGAAYVPLDPAYPEQRLRLMVADTEPVVLLTVRTFAARFPPSVPCVLMDTDGDAIDREVDTSLNLPVSPSQLAYVIYTSGSSGTPKGVLIQHDGLVNQIAAATGQFKLTPHDRVAQVSSLSFDMSVEEIFTTWSAGATLVFHPPGLTGAGEDFSQWVDRNRITVLCLPTAFWHEWAVDLDERGARPPAHASHGHGRWPEGAARRLGKVAGDRR